MTGEQFLTQHEAAHHDVAPENRVHRDMPHDAFVDPWAGHLAAFEEDFEVARQRAIAVCTRLQETIMAWEDDLLFHDGHRGLRIFQDPRRLTVSFSCRCAQPLEERTLRLVALKFSRAVRDMIARYRVRTRLPEGIGQARRNEDRADRRARALLHGFLTREQRWALRATGRFPVRGQDGQTYDVGGLHGVNLLVDGRPSISYCIHARERLPPHDVMIAQKLLLETNVEHFLATANAKVL